MIINRRFKTDLPTSVSKTAPDFCNVYVISKGKISSLRNASRPAPYHPSVLSEVDNHETIALERKHKTGQSFNLDRKYCCLRFKHLNTFHLPCFQQLTRRPCLGDEDQLIQMVPGIILLVKTIENFRI